MHAAAADCTKQKSPVYRAFSDRRENGYAAATGELGVNTRSRICIQVLGNAFDNAAPSGNSAIDAPTAATTQKPIIGANTRTTNAHEPIFKSSFITLARHAFPMLRKAPAPSVC